MRQILKTAYVLALVIFLFPGRVLAYVDPGTGSYFFQFFIALLVGSAFAVKMYWKKIISYFKKNNET